MKLLNETDLRMQFKTATGNYPTFSNEINIEDSGAEDNTVSYVKFLEEQLLEYQNAELVVNTANIESNTYRIQEEARQNCDNCNCG